MTINDIVEALKKATPEQRREVYSLLYCTTCKNKGYVKCVVHNGAYCRNCDGNGRKLCPDCTVKL